jgi:uncharacterized protein (DUF427 family)
MAVTMGNLLRGALPELRTQPIEKWVRASVDGRTVVDSRRALLVWEPRRVVPSYAVPRDDVAATLVPFPGEAAPERPVRLGTDGPQVLDPRTPFSAHSCPGEVLTLRTGSGELVAAAFAPQDADLEDYVVLDWNAFTDWREEDEPVIGHPHDPLHRIECLRTTRHVIVADGDQLLAESTRATMLFENPLGARYYFPVEDARLDVLEPSELRTVCAYKGEATYWSVAAGGDRLADVAWSYRRPLADAMPVKNMVAFFTERLDLTVDGVPVPRPVTPWS